MIRGWVALRRHEMDALRWGIRVAWARLTEHRVHVGRVISGQGNVFIPDVRHIMVLW